MRKKIFYISVFLIFALLLSGCIGGKPTVPDVPEPTDEDLIMGVIEDYFSAINNQEWDLAESYCVDGSYAYKLVDAIKLIFDDQSSQCSTVILSFSPYISKVDIDGGEALAKGYMIIVIKCDGKEHSESGVREFISSLLKVNHNWKLFVIEFGEQMYK